MQVHCSLQSHPALPPNLCPDWASGACAAATIASLTQLLVLRQTLKSMCKCLLADSLSRVIYAFPRYPLPAYTQSTAMASHDSESKFEKTPLNTVRRRPDRGVYDKETIAAIIREARVMHVAFVDAQGLPQCIPMLGVWHEDETGQCYLYFHGYPTTRILSTLGDTGTPVVATATLVDGLVLALSAFSHSMNYRSAVVHGVVLPVSDAEEKQEAIRMIVEQLVPGRWDVSRHPDEEETRGTGILRVKVETASAKIRTGPPKDEKKDTTNQELVAKTWTGVVPLRVVPGTPEPSSYCTVSPPPAHVYALAGNAPQ